MKHTAQDPGLTRELNSARARLAVQERQIQELNHRIANSLQLAADMLVFEQLRARDPMAQAALEASRARLVAVGELHRYLHQHAGEPQIELRPFLLGLAPTISASTGLKCSVACEAIRVPGDTAQQLAIVINEFAINAAKHAYDGRVGGAFDIQARRESGELCVTVRDEGKGLPDDGGGRSGLGMSIIAAIVRDLRGALTVRNEHGAAYTIRVPLAEAGPPASVVIDRSFQSWSQD